jgi:hypothetical protein
MNRLVVIAGYGRSGTSALSGFSHSANVYFGEDLLIANEFNPKGYFENLKLIDINSKILAKVNNSWNSLFDNSVPIFLNEFGDQITKVLQELMSNHAVCAFKEPGIGALFPYYAPILDRLVDVRYVWIIRHPRGVAESFLHRDKQKYDVTATNWIRHNKRIKDYLNFRHYIRIKYKDLIDNPLEIKDRLNLFLSINIPDTSFIDPNLDHYKHECNLGCFSLPIQNELLRFMNEIDF